MRYHPPCISTIIHLLYDNQTGDRPDTKTKLKFSSFFKSVVIELDKDIYGPDNHLIEVLTFILLNCSIPSYSVY